MPAYVYEIRSWDGDLLYVGKTTNPFLRLGQHAATQPWASEMASARITPYETEADALDAEAWAIAALRPLFNTQRPVPSAVSAPAPTGPSTLWTMPGPRPEGGPDVETLTGKVYEFRQREREAPIENPFQGFIPAVYKVTNSTTKTLGASIVASYQRWADSQGIVPVTRRSLFAYVEAQGARRVKTSKGVAFVGLEHI